MELKICHLYPDALNLYGDRGNILCLKKRLEWRGINCSVDSVGIGEINALTSFDLFFIGGGQDFDQEILLEDLQLRLKYAGIPESRIRHIRKKETLLMIIRGSKVPVFILPNYTAMLPLRELLQKETGKAEFWKGNE